MTLHDAAPSCSWCWRDRSRSEPCLSPRSAKHQPGILLQAESNLPCPNILVPCLTDTGFANIKARLREQFSVQARYKSVECGTARIGCRQIPKHRALILYLYRHHLLQCSCQRYYYSFFPPLCRPEIQLFVPLLARAL